MVDLAPAAIEAQLCVQRVRSPNGLHKTRVTSRPGVEDHRVIGRAPDHAADRRLPGEHGGAIPQGRLECVGELIAGCRPFRLDARIAEATRDTNAVALATTPRSPGKWDG